MRIPESISRLSHRLPPLRRSLRIFLLVLAGGYFAFALLLLSLRHFVLPQIESYRPDVERLISAAIERPVSIRSIDAYWVGLHPALTLNGLDIRDKEGRSALGLEQVEAELAWDSLLFAELRLARLEILAPDLVIRRSKGGQIFVAGLEVNPQSDEESSLPDWLLSQHRIVVRDAAIRWIDEKRDAAPLELKKLNFQLDNRFSRHRFGLTAEPPASLAATLDIRGDFKGRDVDELESWKGEVFAELDYADLAAWRQWIDYPVALPQGQGALRLWLGFDRKQLTSATADVKLANVRLKLQKDLPELDLTRLDGRLNGQRLERGFAFKATQLVLATRDGLTLAPTDLSVKWQDAGPKQAAQGNLTANELNLDTLARLAAHLPLEASVRERLRKHNPAGKIYDLALAWKGAPDALEKWSVRGRLDRLQLGALGPVPGLSGISGRIDGDQNGGRVRLDGENGHVDLPSVFAQPRLELERFAADLSWRPLKRDKQALEVTLEKAQFENRDAAGDASGYWQPSTDTPNGPGILDLTGRLTRGSGEAVWRYMPLAVGQSTRTWLKDSLHGGSASDVTFRLKGDLQHFPFPAGSTGKGAENGIFRVHGKLRDVRLDYASSWPGIQNLEGEFLFEGARMLITGKQAKLFGVTLHDVQAEIKNLLLTDELLEIHGKATGPTADFLKFIEASPVGERIDHFTAAMQGEGKGELDIAMNLPLRKLDDTRITGSYRFDGNRLIVDSDLPPLTDVRGQLGFTADSLDSKGLRASLLGSPLAIDIRTGKDSNVVVNAGGELTIAGLRNAYGGPVFDHLSGATKWNGVVRIRKQKADVTITSTLAGISSSLPPPFNKSASDTLPLRFERKPAPAALNPARTGASDSVNDMVDVALGETLRVQLVRQHSASSAPAITRGIIALGSGDSRLAVPPLPDRNVLMSGNLPSVDADFWRKILPDNSGAAAAEGLAGLPPVEFDLRTNELKLFDKTFRDIQLAGRRQGSTTRFELKSPGLAGNFSWDTAGSGKLTGKIGQLAIPETIAQPDKIHTEVGEIVERLPALDVAIGKLSFKGRELGAVNVDAENRDGFWNARFKLDGAETQLKGTLKWRPDPTRSETRLDFGLETKSIEKMLARLGYGDGIRRGEAELSGQLAWNGAPVAIDYPTLTGHMTADASYGQFTKLEPGVGRLLGVLSLQSLPRRITLDFRDIFSEGFAFDRIRGKFDVKQGVMHTTDFQIQGPSAKVLMGGTIDLAHETQNLKVRVQPAVGETIAVGAMIANPVAGAVAWIAQKVLKDPLDQAFAFEYGITGQWQDPKVDKLSQIPAAPVVPAVPVEEKK